MKVFNAGSLINKVQRTTKVLQSSNPEIVAVSTKDQFSINQKGAQLMGLKPGDRILMLDLNIGESGENLNDMDNRFLIAIDQTEGQMKKGLVSEKFGFAYSGTWGAIQLGDPEVTEIPHRNLVEQGVVSANKTKSGTSYVANQKVYFDLEPLVQEDEDGNEVDEFVIVEGADPQPVYRMTNHRVVEHKPEWGKGVAKGEKEADASNEEVED